MRTLNSMGAVVSYASRFPAGSLVVVAGKRKGEKGGYRTVEVGRVCVLATGRERLPKEIGVRIPKRLAKKFGSRGETQINGINFLIHV